MELKFKPKLVIGLGNPDKKYENTYHNAGFLFINYLEENQQIFNFSSRGGSAPGGQFSIFKSAEYMNKSGKFVARALKNCGVKPEKLLIVHDDSDLKLGTYKLQFGRGSAGHKGVQNVIDVLKTKQFWRLRIGIRPIEAIGALKPMHPRQKAEKFVLKKIRTADAKILEKIFAEIAILLSDRQKKS